MVFAPGPPSPRRPLVVVAEAAGRPDPGDHYQAWPASRLDAPSFSSVVLFVARLLSPSLFPLVCSPISLSNKMQVIFLSPTSS